MTGIGSMTETQPDHSIRLATSLIRKMDVSLRKRPIENRSARMFALVLHQQIPEFINRRGFTLGRNRTHDDHSVNEFVAVPRIPFGDGIEFLGGQLQPVGAFAQSEGCCFSKTHHVASVS